MRKASFADMHCSVAQSLQIIGEWWTLLILRDVFLGYRRFEDFVERLGIARNVLTSRLGTLVDAGVLERRPYDEARGRYDYVLTDKGRALWPVMAALRQWGDDWILGEDNAPVILEHRVPGGHDHRTTVQTCCDVCGEVLDGRSVRAVAGPGATPDSRLPPPTSTHLGLSTANEGAHEHNASRTPAWAGTVTERRLGVTPADEATLPDGGARSRPPDGS